MRRWAKSIISSILLVFAFGVISDKFTEIKIEYDDYLYGNANSKFVYYQNTFNPATRNTLQFIIGTGGGTNGSRASNALAYDKLPKSDGTEVKLPSFIHPKTNEFTEKYIAPLYDLRYKENLGNISALLGSPFNSLCALFLEYGIFGSILYLSLFLYVFVRTIKSNNLFSISFSIILIYICILSVIYQTLETPSILFYLFLYMGIVSSNSMLKTNRI